ncbi:HK97 family phage prohead protease [Agrobacterium rosae]|uniref:Phage prohead protease, HK97 family n=1 Tax=Agrobacterium rosae TaxID=1972867 RepID=A0A1R3TS82_9HYPH|nr:HK97 family phage prohead protease [Agrobacterium rosae]SCX27133.1 phage prohead protease, HK97 family [Agrobacterium rosae]
MSGYVQQFVEEVFRTAPGIKFTAADMARGIFSVEEPTRNQIRSVRRAADTVASKFGRDRMLVDGVMTYHVPSAKLKTALAAKYGNVETRETQTREALDFDIRFSAADDGGVFTGHAAVFDERNSFNEIVKRGAFTRTLSEHQTRNIRPPMLWSHRTDEIIGVWTDIREDATGLAVTGKLITETARGKEAHALLKAGALNGLSIGFRARTAERGANGLRILTDIELVEISLVALPSAGNARIKQVRSMSDVSAFTRAVSRTIETLRKD